MSKQPAKKRIKNFNEVNLGFSLKKALGEAARCLQCKKPLCVDGCPVNIDIPAFIQLIKEKRFQGAIAKIKEKNNLPGVCGRVCPQENQCEAMCILGKKDAPINIGLLERFAADKEKKEAKAKALFNKPKVAVVGSGPAGLTAAAELAKMGYRVSLFESLHIPGGVLVYGIPEFRLPKKIVRQEIEYIKSLGVEIKTNCLIGRTFTIDQLCEAGFKAILVATGAGLPQFLNIEGEGADGVYSANEFLTRANLMRAYEFPRYATPIYIGKRVAVVGAGNVAFDCTRVAKRLGAEVTLVYRRTETEMPARKEEIENAEEEGIKLMTLTQPVRILKNKEGFIKGIKYIRMRLGEPDESGRRRPVPISEEEFELKLDTLIVAIGQKPNPLVPSLTFGLKTNEKGTIWVDENLATSLKGVFAAGDIVTGADTVISAMGAAKKAAISIDNFIKEK